MGEGGASYTQFSIARQVWSSLRLCLSPFTSVQEQPLVTMRSEGVQVITPMCSCTSLSGIRASYLECKSGFFGHMKCMASCRDNRSRTGEER